jgi:hypothetical protein
VPCRRECAAIAEAEREHGTRVLARALRNFAKRPEGFDGLNRPWSLFVSQIDSAIAVADGELRREAEAERRGAERERMGSWRCPDCGVPAVETHRFGYVCRKCERPVDEEKAAEWRKEKAEA